MTNDKTYTYWLIYLTDPALHDKFFSGKMSTDLYAYTDKKEHYKLWKSQRNSKAFEVKRKDLSQDEIRYLASKFQRQRIEIVEGETRGHDAFRLFKVAMTAHERIYITSNMAFYLNTLIQRKHEPLGFLVKVIRPSYRFVLDKFCLSDIFDTEKEEPDYDKLNEYDIFKEFIHTYSELLK